jgi:hypothetical protein
MDNKYKKLISYGIALAVSAVAVVIVYFMRINNPPYGMDVMPPIQALSDGLFVAGMMFVSFGALMWISTTCVLDIIGYGFKSVLYLFTPMQKDKDEGGFYEYKLRQKEKRKGVPFEYLWVGIAWVIVALILAAFV